MRRFAATMPKSSPSAAWASTPAHIQCGLPVAGGDPHVLEGPEVGPPCQEEPASPASQGSMASSARGADGVTASSAETARSRRCVFIPP